MDTQKIDWTQPLEAFLKGEWVPAKVVEHDSGDTTYPYCVSYSKFNRQWFTADGKHCNDDETIRNVTPATPTRTALEQRMHSLIKHAAVNASGYTQEEARAILAELEPVDEDLLEARQIVIEYWKREGDENAASRTRVGYADGEAEVVIAKEALSRGRALERGE